MPPKKHSGPSLFCEWVVGTTIPSVLGPVRKKKSIRDVIKVEVTTDEESEEDNLTITYPRSRRTKTASTRNVMAKKVRFQEMPQKSALKKTKAYAISSESDLDTSDSSVDTSESSQILLIPDKNVKVHTVKVPRVQLDADTSSDADSGNDSEPHPTCKCLGCIRGRQRLARVHRRARFYEQLSASETSESETDESSEAQGRSSKNKKKNKGNKSKASDSESSDSGSGNESDQDESCDHGEKSKAKHQENKKKTGKSGNGAEYQHEKNAQKSGKNGKGKNSEPAKEVKADEKHTKSSKKGKGGDKESTAGKKNKDRAEASSKTENSKTWPEATPLPHPRRPNFIEPIRAEVVQTERVVETPQDPPPNAYYDQQHNILRVYHGPVYGGHHNHGLYPKRDSANRPLPIGTAHPTQNPYYYGFNDAPQPLNQGHESMSGMRPGGPWHSMSVPSGYPPAAYGGGPLQSGHGVPEAPPVVNGTKGAFSDKAGRNNVSPVSVKSDGNNRYYKRSSPFGSYVKTSSNVNRQTSSAWNNDGAPGTARNSPQNSWGATANGGQTSNDQKAQQDTWGTSNTQGDDWGGTNDNSNQQAANGWGSQNGANDDNGNQQAAGSWDASGTNNNQHADQPSTWGDQANGSANGGDTGGGSAWESAGDNSAPAGASNGWNNSSNDTGASTESSNVMPGGFPSWGDTSMAADTGGKVDQEDATISGGNVGW